MREIEHEHHDMQFPYESSCPKCGNKNIAMQYRAEGEEVDSQGFSAETFTTLNELGRRKAAREHIACHCRCCHYEWGIETLAKQMKDKISRHFELMRRLEEHRKQCP